MNELTALIQGGLKIWRDLPLGPIEKLAIKALALGLFFYALMYVIERACATRNDSYRSRGFLHDIGYWFYYYSGLNGFLFTLAFVAALEKPLSFLDVKLLTPLPFAVQAIIFILVSDFIHYWTHRAEHRFKFLWAFHTTHHSQVHLTFATNARIHPVAHFYQECAVYVPMRILGVDPMTWLPLFFLDQLIGATHHSRIPWKLGPFYRILSTPTFHAYHHSVDPAHHNRNFGATFSFWDYLFGTAMKEGAPAPTRFGLEDVKPTSLYSTIVAPFLLLVRWYAPRPGRKALDSS